MSVHAPSQVPDKSCLLTFNFSLFHFIGGKKNRREKCLRLSLAINKIFFCFRRGEKKKKEEKIFLPVKRKGHLPFKICLSSFRQIALNKFKCGLLVMEFPKWQRKFCFVELTDANKKHIKHRDELMLNVRGCPT